MTAPPTSDRRWRLRYEIPGTAAAGTPVTPLGTSLTDPDEHVVTLLGRVYTLPAYWLDVDPTDSWTP
ncbi:hypothetical protein SEA_JKSYNGBOY_50 [Gordonia phage JKSyngboy]|uniref:Uncharacterized protein n=1 Tax=Gordonia phage JKSyngboy TaxID=2762400 RepID=A0A7G8LLA2_9CAUD|nr:hypothetical protein J1762_gp50 [Gordonia phage JKSyngboy]QNJ58024.1 hypothetical protein SEA_JKSYNGBOY_50 [Gordonia phage JKSyngboy]URP21119.1 hypothetical protein SEA_FLATWOODS_52 [Gordonia phage Flatwoods]